MICSFWFQGSVVSRFVLLRLFSEPEVLGPTTCTIHVYIICTLCFVCACSMCVCFYAVLLMYFCCDFCLHDLSGSSNFSLHNLLGGFLFSQKMWSTSCFTLPCTKKNAPLNYTKRTAGLKKFFRSQKDMPGKTKVPMVLEYLPTLSYIKP